MNSSGPRYLSEMGCFYNLNLGGNKGRQKGAGGGGISMGNKHFSLGSGASSSRQPAIQKFSLSVHLSCLHLYFIDVITCRSTKYNKVPQKYISVSVC